MPRSLGWFGRAARPRWLLAVGAGAVAGTLFLVQPWGGGAPALELVALNAAGRFDTIIEVPSDGVRRVSAPVGQVMRVPLVLGVRNLGRRAARPERLELSIPARFALLLPDGRPLPGPSTAAGPLVRYELVAPFPRVEPGRLPALVAGTDTLWLELALSPIYCVAFSDSVPEFVPAPAPPPETISRIQIFYSFDGGDLQDRQTGLLTVQLDPEVVEVQERSPAPTFTAEVREPAVSLPPMDALRYAGSRTSACGEPDDPMELLSSVWETPEGGRFLVLYYGGAPRKYLFDLDRDGIAELEMWDPDADERFEARRPARFALPAFLLPEPGPPPFNLAVFDSIPEDSLTRLHRFWRAFAQPYPHMAAPDTTAYTGRLRPIYGYRPEVDRRRGRLATPGGYAFPGAEAAPTHSPEVGAAGAAPAAPADDAAPSEPFYPELAPAGLAQPQIPERATPGAKAPRLLGRPVDSIPQRNLQSGTSGVRR